MARKRRAEEHENHERWLVSYADFITLLFAFFVVMYAVSSVNEGKYKVLSNSLTNAFKNTTGQSGGQPLTVLQGSTSARKADHEARQGSGSTKNRRKEKRKAPADEERGQQHHGSFAATGSPGQGQAA